MNAFENLFTEHKKAQRKKIIFLHLFGWKFLRTALLTQRAAGITVTSFLFCGRKKAQAGDHHDQKEVKRFLFHGKKI
jgi:hypothetical protein